MKASDILARDEIRQFTTASDVRGWQAVGGTWGLIAATFGLVAWWPHPITVAIAVVILGGRQLALAVLMHEASHGSLFATRWLNDTVGSWVCAAPVWTDLARYRTHHLAHHAHTGTERDPDLGLVAPFPTTRASVARKLTRDLFGLTAARRVVAQLAMDAEVLSYSASLGQRWLGLQGRGAGDVARSLVRYTGPVLLTNALLFAALAAAGHAWLYGLWIVAHLTTYNVFLRIRALAEHACMELHPDVTRNTRTTRAGPLARLTVAPLGVNFHLEHHLLMTAPWWQLPRLHRRLRDLGVAHHANTSTGYTRVLAEVCSPTGVPTG